MALDLTKLRRTEFLQLVNATAIGPVLSRSQLGAQLVAGAYKFTSIDPADKKKKRRLIDFFRYAKWIAAELLAAESEPEPEPAQAYEESRALQGEANRLRTKSGQDVYPIPKVVNWRRRKRSERDLGRFCKVYFPATFVLPWSRDHFRIIEKIEHAVLTGGLLAFAMPRASGKTCLVRAASLWAVLYGHRNFVCPIAGSKAKAKSLLITPLKTAILTNGVLAGDFPEAVHPFRRLENTAKRQAQQHCSGELTFIRWEPTKIVFPTLPAAALPRELKGKSPSAGAVIEVTSLDSHLRGPHHARPDGIVARPSLILLDDPQTRDSARSVTRTKFRLSLLFGDVLGMAGPGEQISALMTCTKIYSEDLADQILNVENHPEWRGECTPLLYSLPLGFQPQTSAKKRTPESKLSRELWEKYAEIRADGLRRGKDLKPATAFYRKHRKPMDAGAEAAWPERFTRSKEISAIQHAMNLLFRDEESFFAEYQNDPQREQLDDNVLEPADVAGKINHRPAGQVALAVEALTAFVDVHDKLLYWLVAGWAPKFASGYVVAYGTYPDQGRGYFTLRNCRRTLRRRFPGTGVDAAISAGLGALLPELLSREFPIAGGVGSRRIGRLFVDMGYKPTLVGNALRRIPGETAVAAIGRGIGARRLPISQYKRKPGERYGHHWYVPTVKGTREFRHVVVDTNYWKSFVHSAIGTPVDDPGSLTLFGKIAKAHEQLSEHIAGAERWTETTGHGRTVHEWAVLPSKPDNHWFDCLVGCAAAAAMLGVTSPGTEAAQNTKRKKYSQADLSRRSGR